ncbi:MAG: hypothetical protein K0Q97_2251 [Bacillota bacterium]|jgi:uncharacterized lipoprotein YajG|nr:hypothetical protein [Bacillota bacterium]
MKKIILILSIMIFIFTGCKKENENISFTALIENVSENSMMVTTSDNVGFDKASVSYDKNLKLNFNPKIGQKVKIVILPEIRESYPVQVTAISIELMP